MSEESIKETVTKINPKGRYIFQFPEGTPTEEKEKFQQGIIDAAKENRNVYVEPSVKVFTPEEIERVEVAVPKEEPKKEEPKVEAVVNPTPAPAATVPPTPVPPPMPGMPVYPAPIWNGYGWSYSQYPYGNPQAVYTVPGTTPSVPTQPAQAEGPIPPKKE